MSGPQINRRLAGGLICVVGLVAHAAQAQVTIDEQEATNLHPGVEHTSGRVTLQVDGKRANFEAMHVSLCNDYVHVEATEPGLSLMTPRTWGNRVGAQVALNGDFYTASFVYGDAVGASIRWPDPATGVDNKGEWYYRDYGWIAFGPNWVHYTHSKAVKNDDAAYPSLGGYRPNKIAPDPPAGTRALVSGFPQLVVEGQRVRCASPTAATCFVDRTDMRARHPRSAMGLTKDRKTLILVAVDGRSTTSAGMYGTELAHLMKRLGSYVAFNLDGGGSTGMWTQKEGYVNRPSGGSARSVKNHWGVFAGSGNGRTKSPMSCVAERACDGVDEDFDGAVDEGFERRACQTPDCQEASQACVDGAWTVCECETAPAADAAVATNEDRMEMPRRDASIADASVRDAPIDGLVVSSDGGVIDEGTADGGCAARADVPPAAIVFVLAVFAAGRRRATSPT